MKKKVVEKEISLDHYNFCLFDGAEQYRRINLIWSCKHDLYSEEVNKLVLSQHEKKREILNCISTSLWGGKT